MVLDGCVPDILGLEVASKREREREKLRIISDI
jgi:hypothetical protein